MAARVVRHMSLARASILVFIVVALLTALFMVKMSQGEALPGGPTDSTAVPHYFGPWTNWALSPLTLPDATVAITGNGTGATATATVGGNGAVTGITVTNPGSGYTTATVAITGAGTGAAATATITNSGAVTAITVGQNGSGYKSPVVTISGGGATTDATATAYGGVTGLTLQNAGTGYQFPTVDFDMPDDPNGTKAQADATIDANGAITGITITNPGSGYATAPNVVIRDGTLLDPIINAGAGASAIATINVTSIGLDTFGAGYTSAPTVTITDAVGNGSGATATAAVDNGLVSAITVTAAGTGYVTGSGIRKFVDQLPGLYNPLSGAPTATKYIPLGVPEEKVYNDPTGNPIKADEYEIALVQYRTKFNSDLPATLVRGYVQVETASWVAAHPGVSQHFPLQNELLNGHEGQRHDQRRAGLRRHAAAVARPDDRGDQEQAGPHRLPQPAADGRRRRPLPAGRQHADGLRHGPDGHPRSRRPGHRDGRGAQPGLHRGAQVAGLLQGQPRHAAPPRRHQPVDQRRHAAPVDHAAQRDHPVAAGRRRGGRARHDAEERPQRRRPDLLLHQPAERAAALLPRPRLGHHAPQRVRG